MGEPDGLIDHINGDTLDNRRCNLRIATAAENLANQGLASDNTSGYKGVYWHIPTQKWMAKITVNYKQHYLGTYDKIEDAAAAYDQAAIKYFGEFALTNATLRSRK